MPGEPMATILTPAKTPVKYSCFNLTPSAKNVCIVCEKREDRPTCHRYFYQNTVKTDACKFLEEALDITISFQGVACCACIGQLTRDLVCSRKMQMKTNRKSKRNTKQYQQNDASEKVQPPGNPSFQRRSLLRRRCTGFEMLLMCVWSGGL